MSHLCASPIDVLRRLTPGSDHYSIKGKGINVLIDVQEVVLNFPRKIADDVVIDVHVKRWLVCRASYCRVWWTAASEEADAAGEEAVVRDLVDHTLSLHMAPGEGRVTISLLYDKYVEELSFSTIYLGIHRAIYEPGLTLFSTASCETPHALTWQLEALQRLRVGPEGRAQVVIELSTMQCVGLVNNDPATCAIYVNQIFDVIINVLRDRRHSPLRPYTVVDSFKRVEFQLCESAHVHTNHWIDNAPNL
ncbi:hypothetical protein MRX96_056685 [Rhipicephalus microplus]